MEIRRRIRPTRRSTVVYLLKKRSCASGEWSAFRTKVRASAAPGGFLRVARHSLRVAARPSWQMYGTTTTRQLEFLRAADQTGESWRSTSPVTPLIVLQTLRCLKSSDIMPLAAGTRLGPYGVLAPIGAGAMAEVYKSVRYQARPPSCHQSAGWQWHQTGTPACEILAPY